MPPFSQKSQPHPYQPARRQEFIGIAAIIISCLFFASATVCVKAVSSQADIWLVSWMRFFVGALLSWILLCKQDGCFRIQDKKSWFLRGIFGALAMLVTYLAIHLTSSGRAALLSDTYPLFVSIFGFLLFRERIHWRSWLALGLCLAGVLLVFYDRSHYPMLGNVLGLAGGILGGLAVHYIKASGRRNSVYSVYFSACIFGLVLSTPALRSFTPVSALMLAGILAVGVFAFIGQVIMTYGYRYLPAYQGSIFGLAEIPFTILASVALLGETIRPRFLLGSAVILAGLVLNQSSAHLGRKAPAAGHPPSQA